MSFNFTKLSLLGVTLLFPMMMQAVPAKPGVTELRQPDGTVVQALITGDEWQHFVYTTDGYLLTVDNKGFYVFADESDGKLVATSLLASDPDKRSESEMQAIAGLDREKIKVASMEVANPRMKAPMRGPGRYTTTFPAEGEQKSIAILVEFQNKEFTIDNPKEYYTRMLNEEGFSDYGATGSAREYFIKSSNGKFSPYFDVYGPVKLDKDYSYYGADGDRLAHEMIIDACKLLDDEVDFTEYDRNADGIIDNVYVFYAGYGEADGGGADTIWPHSWDIIYSGFKRYFFDGVMLNHYACSMELQYTQVPDGIGTFCHEFGHVLGLPDLYCTTYDPAVFTLGSWCIMDIGSYNNNSRTPPFYSTYERYALDWIEPEILTEAGIYELENLSDTNHAYMFPAGKEDEFFLFENRQQIGNDLYIPGHGLLIWHIDVDQEIFDNNVVNNDAKHQYVDLVEADDRPTEGSRNGDSFPGASNVTSFTSETSPAFLSWNGNPVGFDITDISESEEGKITFTVISNSDAGMDGVKATAGFILIADMLTCRNNSLNVYNVSGQKVVGLSYGESIKLPEGIYIVSYGKESHKIAIR